MTLITGGESPKHSKWHVISGIIVLLNLYVLSLWALKWWMNWP